jgi:hypothetical protein
MRGLVRQPHISSTATWRRVGFMAQAAPHRDSQGAGTLLGDGIPIVLVNCTTRLFWQARAAELGEQWRYQAMDNGDRYSTDAAEQSYWERHSNPILGGSALGVLATGTVVYRLIEDWSWVDAFYFSAVALTTVGFGDLSPSSDGSKLFTVVYIFTGIAIISVFINERLKHNARRFGRVRNR